ncbi:ADP-ribosyl cyclase/cyclic ADP-ribose hydrolase 1 isoform X1 [Phyllopteryx taeniolatus]|uniref:ADP-ribosyl cyclase/cyclic ADP-ribose hydrolase 1 isoform X1 n=2 Tax=Phyllopteryx taeniolatus TaxID=161469 RepID=UPI002AD3297A|nr:ADP-ribosyl cyclase/cyclic ADP-ribose hydrolase 1 isoform X1 [Phyllopteryx taeniolatus]XP_061614904.1 ADP-ribosyl cyclase/cyclic ADP-ribose hydrolase 1 isoform X1 [Phyllopteryx taeniolatus]
MTSVTACFLVLSMCASPLRAFGTTANIKHIVMGRCFDYVTLVNPSVRYDCEEIWRAFEEAVVRQASCDVAAEHYRRMFQAMPQTWACDRFLFWSKTKRLIQDYTAVARHFRTLEDTLAGYMFNDLVWCGQQEDADFDFSSCPKWSACLNHPVHSLWRQASENFAELACGNVTVLLNGSIENAFNRNSMFGSVELDNLNPQRVNYVNIKVVTNLEGPFIESCGEGSVVDLIHILQSRGFRWTCSDNDQILMILQCVRKPEHASCRTCADSLSAVQFMDFVARRQISNQKNDNNINFF